MKPGTLPYPLRSEQRATWRIATPGAAARQWRRAVALCAVPALLVLLAGWDNAESLAQVTHAAIRPCAPGHCLDATIEYHLGETLYEALHNGIPLTVQTDVVLCRPRVLLWDKVVTTQRLRHRLEYQVLSKRYRLLALDDRNRMLRFASLKVALEEIGRIRELALPANVDADAGDYVRIRSSLDTKALPNPLKPTAYLQDQWRLASRWTRLEIR